VGHAGLGHRVEEFAAQLGLNSFCAFTVRRGFDFAYLSVRRHVVNIPVPSDFPTPTLTQIPRSLMKSNRFAVLSISVLLFSCSTSLPSDEEQAMMIAIQSMLFEPDAVPTGRTVALNGVLYPEADSIPLPQRVAEWATLVHDLPILDSSQIDARDTSISILTLYPTRRDEEGLIHVAADFFKFEGPSRAIAHSWKFTVKCGRKAGGGEGCDQIAKEGPGVLDYGL
jgi:hypothetical protein